MTQPLFDDVLSLAARADLAERMAAFYSHADEAIAAHDPVCRNRGDCCKFESFGHRLFVTTPELAYFAQGLRTRWRTPIDDGACPFQLDGRCTAREHRPLGCRVFFCDPRAADWQGSEYERLHSALKGVCDKLGTTYRYVEWLSALRDLSGVLEDRTDPAHVLDSPRGGVIHSLAVLQGNALRSAHRASGFLPGPCKPLHPAEGARR